MVAVIYCTQSIRETLNYNERKLKPGTADCIHAVNYPKDLVLLSYLDKLHRLEHLALLNERAKSKSVHITLNFHRADKLPNQKLILIAEEYMLKIGFGQQPYLVYAHYDAGHQHLHIVSTNIQHHGSQIKMYNVAGKLSKNASKELEEKYKLVAAGKINLVQKEELVPKPAFPYKVTYGKSELSAGMGDVLYHVLHHYRVTSIEELNAVLRLYNLKADRGGMASVMYQQKGLLYRVLDQYGKRIGMPMKASILPHKPTLKYLDSIFEKNIQPKLELKRLIKISLDWILYKTQKLSIQEFGAALRHEGITAILGHPKSGFIEGITYIDHKRGSVIQGDELGEKYSAKALFEKCGLGLQISITPKMTSRFSRSSAEGAIPEDPGQRITDPFIVKPEIRRQELPSLNEIGNMMALEDFIRYLPKNESNPASIIREKKRGQRMGQSTNW